MRTFPDKLCSLITLPMLMMADPRQQALRHLQLMLHLPSPLLILLLGLLLTSGRAANRLFHNVFRLLCFVMLILFPLLFHKLLSPSSLHVL